MKTQDDVMQELLKAKQANAERFGNLKDYIAFLMQDKKKKHPGGVIPAPKRAKAA